MYGERVALTSATPLDRGKRPRNMYVCMYCLVPNLAVFVLAFSFFAGKIYKNKVPNLAVLSHKSRVPNRGFKFLTDSDLHLQT